jgi:YidC/Oxa1 family membrane protein insertase
MDQSDQQKRLLLTIVVSMAFMVIWMMFFAPQPPPPAGPDGGVAQAGDAGQPAAQAPDAGAAPGAIAQAPAADQAEPPPPEERIEFTTPALELAFSNHGGGLTRARIKNGGVEDWPDYKFSSREKDEAGEYEPANVVELRPEQPLAGAAEVSGELKFPLDAAFRVERAENAVSFRAQNAQVAFEKRYEINPNGYELRVEYRVTNRTDAPKQAKLGVVYPAWVDPKTQGGGSFFSPPPELSQGICLADGDVERMGVTDEAKRKSFQGPVQFAGFDQRYFMGVLFPRFHGVTGCELASEPNGSLAARVETELGTIKPGETVTREFGMYLGPKALSELQRVSAANAAALPMLPIGEEVTQGPVAAGVNPALSESVDFGWWAVIARALLWVLRAFQKLVQNWGVAIILLTLLVKLLLYPLSHKQMESMEAMRRLQPQMDALAKKYENDKEKLNLERMKLFQENKVNPFGGCLPLLVQMPVWIALYRTLLSSFELYREPFIAPWISDLTLADPFYVLPLAMGVTMFITQKMQPQMGDPTQAKVMLYVMPIFFTFIMLNLPAGLTLYIFTNNLLSIAQQKWLQHKFSTKKASAS